MMRQDQREEGRGQAAADQELRKPTDEQRRIVEEAAEGLETDFEPAWDELGYTARQVATIMSPRDENDSIGEWYTIADLAEAARATPRTVTQIIEELTDAGFVVSTWTGPARDELLLRIEV